MTTFSSFFNLNKSQCELDFVDINLYKDMKLYIDPFAISIQDNEFSSKCNLLIINYFETILNYINNKQDSLGIKTLINPEPRETHLGVSKVLNKNGKGGRGIGYTEAKKLFNKILQSKASKTGLLNDLSDLSLFVEGIGRDKISDMTTNIIRKELILYTQAQCEIHNIKIQKRPSGKYWNIKQKMWSQEYLDLPICNEQIIILVPKYIVRYDLEMNSEEYRSKFVLEFLQAEHLRADDSLVSILKNNKGEEINRKVYKKTVDEYYPKNKDFLAEFSHKNPEIIEEYKIYIKDKITKPTNIPNDNFSEADLCNYLTCKLNSIGYGKQYANDYHKLIIGIISFLFFPNLIYPKYEHRINEERKRIDVTYTNAKEEGFFYRIALDENIKANIVHIECKNYNNDISNPEFDQSIGRFDEQRGRLGMLFYRKCSNENSVLNRAKDTAKSNQGIILPINDNFINECFELIKNGNRYLIDKKIDNLYNQIIS